MTIEASLAINIGTIIFAAGILYGKITTLEKQVSKMDDHGEKIAAIDARLHSLEKNLQ